MWPVLLLLAGKNRAPRLLFWSIVGLNLGRAASIVLWPSGSLAIRTHMRADGLAWGCLAAFALVYFPGFEVRKWAFWICLTAAPFFIAARTGMNYVPAWMGVIILAAMTVLPASLAAIAVATVEHPHWHVSRLLDSPVSHGLASAPMACICGSSCSFSWTWEYHFAAAG